MSSICKDGYVRIYSPSHHRAKSDGYVREHILIAEKTLGRRLVSPEVVHHINHNPGDNRPENLFVCRDQAEHLRIHTEGRAFDASGNANFRKCTFCKQYDSPDNLIFNHKHRPEQGHHKVCQDKYNHARYIKLKTLAATRAVVTGGR